MRKWDALNDRQLTLLRRIGEGDDLSGPEGVDMRTSARALQNRDLVDVTRRGGTWRATITPAGTYYLEHGHHPDRPATDLPEGTESPDPGDSTSRPRQRAASKTVATGAASPATASADLIEGARDLIARLQHDDGTVTLESPDPETRATYRRLLHACTQHGLVPEGQRLLHTGRDRGDLVIRLANAEAGQSEWNRVRLDSRRVTTNPELLTAALQEHPSVLTVSERLRPRAIKLVAALAKEAQRNGYRVGVNTKLKTPKLFLQAGKVRRDIRVEEEHDQIPHKLTDEDRRALRSRGYWTPPPQFDTVPSGRISIHISRAAWGTQDSWSDTPGDRLEKQLPQIIRDVAAALEAEEAARNEAAREAEERHARWAREEEEKRKAWETAMDQAEVHAAESSRRRSFRGAYDDWAAAGELRRFCDALETTLAERTPHEQHNLARWISWARAAADEIDATRNPAALAIVDFEVEPGPDDLRPFLGGWSPHRPDKEHAPSLAQTPMGPPAEARRAWHHGMRGQPSWWR